MLGLLRKDLDHLKFHMLTYFALIVFIGIVALSMEETGVFRANTFVMYASTLVPHVVTRELQQKTVALLRALPLPTGAIVGAKFAWLLTFVSAQLGLLWLFQFFLTPVRAPQTVLSLSWTTFMALSLASLLLLVRFAVPDKRVNWLLVVAFAVAFYVWATVDLKLRFETENPSTFFNTGPGYAIAAAVGLLVVAGAWMWASQIFARRDLTEMQ